VGIAGDLVLVLVAALLGGLLARALGLPLILGYVLAGLLVGPNTAGPTVSDLHDIELLADVGVALLLFSLGLEFPLRKLAPIRRVALLGTPLQMLLTIAGGFGLARLVGWGWLEAVWFGALLSLSSTAVALKTLMDQRVLDTLAGRVMVGMLLVQDLALVPLLTVLPSLARPGTGAAALGVAALKALGFVAAMLLFGARVLPGLMGRVVSWRSRELFLIATAAVGLGVGYGTYLAGLSFGFGAFLAGMILGESAYSHQALADISPLRDVFAMVFFVTVGMLIVPSVLWDNVLLVLVLLPTLLVGKGLIFAAVTRLFAYGNIVPLAAGLTLFQVGEFSFLLARQGIKAGAISPDLYGVFLAVAALSMALTPLTARTAGPIYRWWRRRRPGTTFTTRPMASEERRGHTIVAGYGRVGAVVARLVAGLVGPPVVVELDPDRARTAEKVGFSVVYGDAASDAVLEAAGVSGARLLVLTMPDPVSVRLAVERARGLNPTLPVLARAVDERVLADLARLGVTEAVQPELEAALEITRQAMGHLGIGRAELEALTEMVHREHYAPLVQEGADRDISRLMERVSRAVDVETVRVNEGSVLVGRTIAELDIRRRTGALIIAVRRGPIVIANPEPSTTVEAGDVVVVTGTGSQRREFRRLAQSHEETTLPE